MTFFEILMSLSVSLTQSPNNSNRTFRKYLMALNAMRFLRYYFVCIVVFEDHPTNIGNY